jgi:oxygen-independent coproporphyrinogen-3 oxidase
LTKQGLIEAVPGTRRIRATGNGRFILNEIVLRLAMSFTSDNDVDHDAKLPQFHFPPAAE